MIKKISIFASVFIAGLMIVNVVVAYPVNAAVTQPFTVTSITPNSVFDTSVVQDLLISGTGFTSTTITSLEFRNLNTVAKFPARSFAVLSDSLIDALFDFSNAQGESGEKTLTLFINGIQTAGTIIVNFPQAAVLFTISPTSITLVPGSSAQVTLSGTPLFSFDTNLPSGVAVSINQPLTPCTFPCKGSAIISTAQNTLPGTYNIIFTDGSGQKQNFALTISTTSLLAINPSFAQIAVGERLILTGSGGIPPYLFGFKPGFPGQGTLSYFTSDAVYFSSVFSLSKPDMIRVNDSAGAFADAKVYVGQTIKGPASATLDKPVTFQITGFQPFSSVTVSLNGQQLGPQAAMDSEGTGNPTYTIPSTAALGPGTVSVTGRTAYGTPASASYSINIEVPPLAITTSSLPSGQVGVSYSATLIATGGMPPYTWGVSGLPNGLSVKSGTGVISGTPSIGGSFNVVVRVTDSVGLSLEKSFNLVITVPTLPINFNPASGATLPVDASGSATVKVATSDGVAWGTAIDFDSNTKWSINGVFSLQGQVSLTFTKGGAVAVDNNRNSVPLQTGQIFSVADGSTFSVDKTTINVKQLRVDAIDSANALITVTLTFNDGTTVSKSGRFVLGQLITKPAISVGASQTPSSCVISPCIPLAILSASVSFGQTANEAVIKISGIDTISPEYKDGNVKLEPVRGTGTNGVSYQGSAVYKPVSGGADLAVEKLSCPDHLFIGNLTPVPCQVLITNSGPGRAQNVTATFVPQFEGVKVEPPRISFGDIAAGNRLSGEFSLSSPGTAPAGATANTVQVSADIPDPNSANNALNLPIVLTTTIGVGESATLRTADGGTAVISGSASYTLNTDGTLNIVTVPLGAIVKLSAAQSSASVTGPATCQVLTVPNASIRCTITAPGSFTNKGNTITAKNKQADVAGNGVTSATVLSEAIIGIESNNNPPIIIAGPADCTIDSAGDITCQLSQGASSTIDGFETKIDQAFAPCTADYRGLGERRAQGVRELLQCPRDAKVIRHRSEKADFNVIHKFIDEGGGQIETFSRFIVRDNLIFPVSGAIEMTCASGAGVSDDQCFFSLADNYIVGKGGVNKELISTGSMSLFDSADLLNPTLGPVNAAGSVRFRSAKTLDASGNVLADFSGSAPAKGIISNDGSGVNALIIAPIGRTEQIYFKGATCTRILQNPLDRVVNRFMTSGDTTVCNTAIKVKDAAVQSRQILPQSSLWVVVKEVLSDLSTNDDIKHVVKALASYNGINIPEWGVNGGDRDARKLKAGTVIDLSPLYNYLALN